MQDWIVPDWPVPPRVRALCSTRAGGVSVAPCDGANLGDHVGDAPDAVARNRALFATACGVPAQWLRQVHGVAVHEAVAIEPAPQADACTTTHPGIACTAMVADCLPVLLADARGHRVAAAHAGWRGLAGGVLEAVLQSFVPVASVPAQSDAMEVIAWLGPCIGPDAFEVGADVVAAFPQWPRRFRRSAGGRWLADLPGLARDRLLAAGVRSVHGNDGSAGWCTVTDASRFFSHRRDSGRLGGTGRFAAAVWLDAG